MANLLTLASGSSVVLTVTDGQTIVVNNAPTDRARLEITTGRGAGTVVTANHNGRRIYGPFSAGTITLAAISGAVRYELSGDSVSPMDDDAQPLTAIENQSVRTLSVAEGNVTSAALLTLTGTANQTVRISDGDDAGALLIWAIPDGSTSYAWCWHVWPKASYF